MNDVHDICIYEKDSEIKYDCNRIVSVQGQGFI